MKSTKMKVENFIYNGFMVEILPGYASYTATFRNWTDDPGIAVCMCSDGKARLIPSCCLSVKLPKQTNAKVLFGKPSRS